MRIALRTFGIVGLLAMAGVAAAQAPPEREGPGDRGPFGRSMLEQERIAAPAPPGMPRPPRDLGRWWKDTQIAQELGLTSAQVNQIEEKFQEHRLKLIDLHADLERQEAKLQPLIEADQPDEAKVGPQIDQVVGARGKLEKANVMMMLSIRRVLSVEQWKKLEAIQHEHHRRLEMPAPPPGEGMMRPPKPPDDTN